jgi:hypothetical protein
MRVLTNLMASLPAQFAATLSLLLQHTSHRFTSIQVMGTIVKRAILLEIGVVVKVRGLRSVSGDFLEHFVKGGLHGSPGLH